MFEIKPGFLDRGKTYEAVIYRAGIDADGKKNSMS